MLWPPSLSKGSENYFAPARYHEMPLFSYPDSPLIKLPRCANYYALRAWWGGLIE